MAAQTPTPAPEQPAETPDPETGPSAPLSVTDAWADVLVAVSRVEPADDLSRAVAAAARANIRAEIARNEQPTVTDEVLLAFQFMGELGRVLGILEHRKAEAVAEVMNVLFAARQPAPPGPNGAYRG